MDKNNTGQSVEESFKAEMDRASAANAAGATNTPASGSTGTQPKDATAPASPQGSVEPPKYKLPDGREVTGDQVLAEYNNLHKDYTVKTQKLTELEKSTVTSKADLAPARGEGQELSEVDRRVQSEMKRLGYPTRQEVEELLTNKKPEFIQESSKFTQDQLNINQRFDAIEAKYDGQEGKPKVDRSKVLEWINEKKAFYLTPEEATNIVYHEDIVKMEARGLAGGGTPNLPVTEKSGAAVTDPPKPPGGALSFQNGSAERAFREAIGQTPNR